jgi:hypothetical protein
LDENDRIEEVYLEGVITDEILREILHICDILPSD